MLHQIVITTTFVKDSLHDFLHHTLSFPLVCGIIKVPIKQSYLILINTLIFTFVCTLHRVRTHPKDLSPSGQNPPRHR